MPDHGTVAYWKDTAQLVFLIIAGVWLVHGVITGSYPSIKSAVAAS